MPGLIDIGANLAHDSFNRDRDAVLQRAWDAGLDAIVITGSSRESSHRARELAQFTVGHPSGRRLYATAGLHPHHATEWSSAFADEIRELARDPVVVSLGECGLDYNRSYSPHDAQRSAFAAQLELAAQLKKPAFLHQRDAHADFIAILREHRARLGDVCVHCFTDTRAALDDYLAAGCYIGITGWICDERRGRELYETSRAIPDDRLMIETDAPYLLPRNAPKTSERRNEPMYLPYVARALAEARGATVEHVAQITSANARRFFRIGA
jgi:TatD DNase family protein